LIISHLSRPAFLQTKLDKISEETERFLENILSPEQLRDYRSLSGPAEILSLHSDTDRFFYPCCPNPDDQEVAAVVSSRRKI
jgi:hypothetical protein